MIADHEFSPDVNLCERRPALIVQHPSAPTPKLDPAFTAEAIQVLDATEALTRIAADIGWKRLSIIVRNLAYVHGEEV